MRTVKPFKGFPPRSFQRCIYGYYACKNGLNGIETAEKLRTVAARIPLYLCGAMSGIIPFEGYRVHPLDYLLKPVDADALDWCLNEIRTFLSEPAYIEIQAVLGQGSHPASGFFWMIFIRGNAESPPDHPHVKGDVATRLSFLI